MKKRIALILAVVVSITAAFSAFAAPHRVTGADREALSSIFDAELYASEYPDVVAVYGTAPERLFDHFCAFGIYEARKCCKTLDVYAYYSAY